MHCLHSNCAPGVVLFFHCDIAYPSSVSFDLCFPHVLQTTVSVLPLHCLHSNCAPGVFLLCHCDFAYPSFDLCFPHVLQTTVSVLPCLGFGALCCLSSAVMPSQLRFCFSERFSFALCCFCGFGAALCCFSSAVMPSQFRFCVAERFWFALCFFCCCCAAVCSFIFLCSAASPSLMSSPARCRISNCG
jgi:hypothetical protein